MSTLRKALHVVLFAAFVALPLAAQLTDCAFTRTFTGDLNAASSSNISGNTPCVNWRVTFSVSPPPDNLTSTVTFQTSPDNTNWTSVPNTICSVTVQPPCILQGTNPLTGTTQGMSLFAAYGSYVRVITSGSAGTGTGTIRGYGSKGATASSSGAGGGGGVTIPLTTNLLAGNGSGGVSDGGVTPTTSVGTPGVDTKVPTEKAVRTALALLIPYVGATANVDLATFDLLTSTGNGGFGTDLRTGNVLPMTKLVAWGGNLVVGDPATLGTESLTNGALTSGTSWTQTGDFALTGNAAVYTHSSGTGTIVQANVDLAVKLVDNRWYKLVYTISAVTAGVSLSLPAAICDTAFSCAFDSTAGVAKVFYWKTATGASALAFTVTGTSTAGGLTLDNLSLKEVQGGNAVIYGKITGGGTAGIKVLANGNVGIGTDPSPGPQATLQIDTISGGLYISHQAPAMIFGDNVVFASKTNSMTLALATTGGNYLNSATAGDGIVAAKNNIEFGTGLDVGVANGTIRFVVMATGQVQVPATGVLQQLPRTTDPTCSTTADIGKFWFDNTTTTTAAKKCVNVAGTLTWVAF